VAKIWRKRIGLAGLVHTDVSVDCQRPDPGASVSPPRGQATRERDESGCPVGLLSTASLRSGSPAFARLRYGRHALPRPGSPGPSHPREQPGRHRPDLLPRTSGNCCQDPAQAHVRSQSSCEPCMSAATASDASAASVMPTGMRQDRHSSGVHRFGLMSQGLK
jgi:hypothetical protein